MEQKEKLLLAVGVGLIASDIVPTVADYFVFKKDQELKEQLEKGEITPKQYSWSFNVFRKRLHSKKKYIFKSSSGRGCYRGVSKKH